MRKKKLPPENPFLKTEHGINTIQAIADTGNRFHVFPITLNDGDEVGITGEVAEGILKIRDALNPQNRERINQMDLLHLLHTYTEAVKDGVLIPSKLNLYSEVIKRHMK